MPSPQRELPDEKRKLIDEILRLHSRREALNLASAKRIHPQLVHQVFSIRPFWGWLQALRDAGLDYETINAELEEFIECRVCGRFFRRLPIHLKLHEITTEEYREKFNAETHSEMERAKLQRRGRSGRRTKGQLPLWDAPFCEEVTLDRIAEYHRVGISVHYDEIDRRERSLVNHAIRHFGSWDQALRKIGLDPEVIRLWCVPGARKYPTPHSVLEAIRWRHQAGLPLHHTALMAPRRSPLHRDQALFRRAIACFGSWDETIRRAGLPGQRLASVARYTTAELVLEEIQRRQREGMPLNAAALTAGLKQHRDEPLYRNGKEFFASWNHAIAQAGVPSQAKRCLGGRYPTADSVISEIRRRAQAGLPLGGHLVRKRFPKDIPLYKCAARHFGNWSNALEAAQVAGLP